ncbi:hypothetical protein BH09PSE2_BH09PSE2_25420 [soil metagenome]
MPLIPAVLALTLAAAAAAPTYTVTDRIAGPDGGWDLAAVANGRLYVARSKAVMSVDLATKAMTPSLVPLSGGHGILAIPGGDLVLATSGGLGTATLFKGATGEIVATIPVGKNPDAMTWDPATKTAWVFNPGSHDASVIDPVAAKVIDTVAIPGARELGAADGKGRIYLNVEDKNEVAVIDTRARKLLSTFPLAGCDGPTGIAYSLKAKMIVSACGNGVAIVSAPDGKQVATLKIGPRPDGAAFDEQRGRVLIPTGGDGALSVIRLSPKPEVLSVAPTAKSARTIALDPATGVAYLPSAQYGPAPAAGGRAPLLPGTFAVLVVGPASPAQ